MSQTVSASSRCSFRVPISHSSTVIATYDVVTPANGRVGCSNRSLRVDDVNVVLFASPINFDEKLGTLAIAMM